MSLFRTPAAALALLLALPACAAPTKQAHPAGDADPALWVVKDRDTTIYLFGTIHVLKPGLTWFDEAVKAAFDRSGTLALEMVQPEPAAMQQLVLAKGMNPGGKPIAEQLPPAARAGYAKALADNGIPATAFDAMKPWLAAVSLSVIPLGKLGYDAANGPETVLTEAAKAEGKRVIGLETATQQLGYFDALSNGAQVTFLASTIDELPKVSETMAKMVDEWSAGDPDALAADMNDSLKDSPEVAKVLLVDRNRNWAKWIAGRMKQPGTVFVAVGAGHLAGPESVQNQLREYRIRAVRVKY